MITRNNLTLLRKVLPVLVCTIAAVFVLSILIAGTSAAESIEVKLDEEPLKLSVDPIITEGTTLVQFRPLFEAMGLELKWDNNTKTITGMKDGFTLIMTIDKREALINDQTIEIQQPPRIIEGSTMVPIRFISEATGALVSWNPYVPEVTVFTEVYWESKGITKDELADAVREEIELMKKKRESQPDKTASADESDTASTDTLYEPAVSDQVDLEQLQGMYAGYRLDPNGYECGGLCWDFYTFLQDHQILIGLPEKGGPETIDCSKDDCQTYTISNGQLSLSNGESFEISVDEQVLAINEVSLARVKPVDSDLKLSDKYEYYGHYGAGGLAGYSSSWIYTLSFNEDGTFENDVFRIGSTMGGNASTHGFGGVEGEGTYEINGNTITLTYSNGNVEQQLFFLHETPDMGELDDIQIGDLNYWVAD